MTVLRFPRPLTGDQVRAGALRELARPAPIGTRGVRVDADAVIHHPGRAVARRWSQVVRCGWCGAVVRAATPGEVLGALLGDEGMPDGQVECMWCGPGGVRREHPPVWPVWVCVLVPWQVGPVR